MCGENEFKDTSVDYIDRQKLVDAFDACQAELDTRLVECEAAIPDHLAPPEVILRHFSEIQQLLGGIAVLNDLSNRIFYSPAQTPRE